MVRSQRVASTFPPPIANPLTRAMTGLGTSRIRPCNSSIGNPTTPRPSYCPSCADWSPPVQKALSPTPVSTMLETLDRKSTRLNSSHANISYAVFCLKKKHDHHATPRSVLPGKVHVVHVVSRTTH